MFIESVNDYLAYRQRAESIWLEGKQRILVPCANTLLARRDLVIANTYNPNHVSDNKMELLFQSIVDNGFAFPIVTLWDDDQQLFVVVDGFHRYLISGPDWLELSHVPLAVLNHNATQRMVATWQFNKARGSHEVDLDADLIRALIEQGMEESEIGEKLGIDMDTVHRYKQVTGIAELFKNANYSLAWSIEERDE